MSAAVHTLFVAKPDPVARPQRPEKTPPLAPVTVNGVVIGPSDIAQELQNHPAETPNDARNAAVRALVVRELLLQRATALGIEPEPMTDSADRRETEEEALIRSLLEREVKTPEPDDETCRRYYRQNPGRFQSAPLYEASHILFAARRDDPAAFERARTKAEAVLAELKQRPEGFAQLARLHSDCPSAVHGGNLGQITADQVTTEFANTLGELGTGDFTPVPVETRYGLHIIRLERVTTARELPYEVVADRVQAYLRERVIHHATAQYVARLVSGAIITGVELKSS